MRVKKRVKKGVKRGLKRVKSAPPEAYLAGSGVLVGAAAVLLLATTKSGRELLMRTAQLALHPTANEQESQESDVPEADEQESQESDVREDLHNEPEVEEEPVDEADVEEEPVDEADVEEEPVDEADVEEEPEEDADGDEESKVTDLKPRDQRRRSAAPGRRPRSSTREPAPAGS